MHIRIRNCIYNLLNILRFLKHIIEIDKSVLRLTCLIFVIVVISMALSLSFPMFQKMIIDVFANKKSPDAIFFTVLLYSLLWMANLNFFPLRNLIAGYLVEKVVYNINSSLFKQIHNSNLLDKNSFREGKLINIIDKINNGTYLVFNDIIVSLFPSIIELIIAIFILYILYNFQYSLILLVIFIIYMVSVISVSNKIIRFQNLENQIKDQNSTILLDNLRNLELIKIFAKHKYEIKKYNKNLLHKKNISQKGYLFQYKIKALELAIISFGVVSAIGMSAYEISNNTLTVGDFIVINTYISEFLLPLGSLGTSYLNVQRLFVNLDETINLIKQKESEKFYKRLDNRNGQTLIEVDSIDFTFPDMKTPIFTNFNLNLNGPGIKFLVGSSGIGKSTIFRLIAGLYTPSKGLIKINGNNVQDLNLSEIMSIMPQEKYLFNRTILENITYSVNNDSIFRKKISEALGIDKFVQPLPNQYNTILDLQNLNLSGGQKQLICLARCLLKKAEIYLLDEPTSALDVEAEALVMNYLRKIAESKMIIFISHDSRLINQEDEVINLSGERC